MANKIKKQCLVCGKDVFAWMYQKDTRKYCSRKCSLEHTKIVGGWNRGLKGFSAWNKGLTGISCGEKNPNWKGGKQKLKCVYCETTFLDRKSKSRTPKFCSHRCFSNHRKETGSLRGNNHPNYGKKMSWLIGEHNHNWMGGITPKNKLERSRFQQTIQKQVFERDNYTCQMCEQKGGNLQVDHIQPWAEYVELRFDINNCRTLCMDCHYFITFGKKKPEGVIWGHNLKHAEMRG